LVNRPVEPARLSGRCFIAIVGASDHTVPAKDDRDYHDGLYAMYE
jgi:hypothetical protein